MSSPNNGWWQASDGRLYPPDQHHDAGYRSYWALQQSPPGRGWWIAADGRYYPPEQHLDPDYRAKFESMEEPGLHDLSGPPDQWPAAVAGTLQEAGPPSNLLATLFASVGAIIGVAGTFLSWVDFSGAATGSLRGWDLDPDGQIVLAGCLIAAAVAGAMWAGVRHLAVKLLLLLVGIVCIGIAVVKLGDVANTDSNTSFVDLESGVGLWLLGPAGISLMLASLLERSPWDPRAPR